MSPRSRLKPTTAAAGCLLLLGACAALFWAIGGHVGLIALTLGKRNPFAYTAPTNQTIEETRQLAIALVARLEAWKAAHGAYPASLDLLTTRDHQPVPLPLVGDRQWLYTRPSPDRFVLDFFVGPHYQHVWWDSAEGKWQSDF